MTGTTTPGVMAAAGPAADAKTPLIALAPNRLDGDKFKWTFTMPQPIGLMAEPLLEHAKSKGYKTVAFLGYHPDAYGEVWIKRDGSPGAQVRRHLRPDRRLRPHRHLGRRPGDQAGQPQAGRRARRRLGFPGGDGALRPGRTRLQGPDLPDPWCPSPVFLKNGGKSVENGILVAGPLLEWEQLPDSHPSKKVSGEYAKAYEAKYGQNSLSSFGGHMWDGWAIASRAIPVALKKAKPGTAEFRAALRDAIESEREIAGVHGVFNLSPTDHSGFDGRARVLLQVQNGAFKVISK
jgi:branched-chain amino acid transport system substrate-binding protein